MPSRYHPLYDGLWTDDKLEGAPFEEYGFFVYLFSNHRQRPAGIYRVEDQQLAADTHLTLARVRRYLGDLEARGVIVRDGAWIWVRSYFKRQPKHDNLLRGAREDYLNCTSARIAAGFIERYPHLHQWSADRRRTVAQPMNEIRSTEQSSTEQSRAVQGECEGGHHAAAVPGSPATGSPGTHTNGFVIPPALERALAVMPILGPRLRDPAWWRAQLRAHPALDIAAEALKAEAWCASNARRGPKRDPKRFLHNWFTRTEEPR